MKTLLLSFLLAVTARAADIKVFFSPKGGCTEAVVAELTAAKKSVWVQAYSFTSAPIAKALVDARKRGIAVSVILDKSQRTEKIQFRRFPQERRDFRHNRHQTRDCAQ